MARRAREEWAIRATAADLTAAAVVSTSRQCGGADGIRVDYNVSSISGAGAHNFVFTIEGYDIAARAWFTVLASAAATAAARGSLTVFPGAAATTNVSVNNTMPQQFRIRLSGTATAISATAAIGYIGE